MRQPPSIPDNVPDNLRDFFSELDNWMTDVYTILRNFDLGQIKFTSSAAAPTGGEDGDMHWRIDGANTALYLNINGSWSAYTNP